MKRARNETGGLGRIAKGASGAVSVQVVRVENDGGNAGSDTSACTFTYSIYADQDDISGLTPLATGLTPARGRPGLGEHQVAPAGSRGLAYQSAGEWILLEAYAEVELVEAC